MLNSMAVNEDIFIKNLQGEMPGYGKPLFYPPEIQYI
jgi:hypothetical protein